MKKLLTKIAAGFSVMILIPNLAFAATIVSSDNQTFDINQTPEILYEITITGAVEGDMKINIPDDIAMIFDDERTVEEFILYGDAVDNDKILEKPAITFEDGDKTLVIPVIADFAEDEEVVVKDVYVKGFNSSGEESSYLKLTFNSESTSYLDTKTKFVRSSSLQDTQEPEMPSNIKVKDVDNGVELSWTDPTDLDLSVVEVLRGKNNSPVDGTPYTTVAAEEQKFVDTDVENGETVKYILRASDGVNNSDLTTEISFVVGSSPEEEEDPEDPVDPEEEDPEDPENNEDEDCGDFTDIESDDALCDAISFVKEEGIFVGYSDGSFKPNQKINRAEFLKVVFTTFEKEAADTDGLTFRDVDNNAWYAPYIAVAKSVGIVDGYPDGTFKPEQTVLKVEAYKILLEASEVELAAELSMAPYNDTPMGSWYLRYAAYAEANELEVGPNFYPAREMTRGQVAEMIYKFKSL